MLPGTVVAKQRSSLNWCSELGGLQGTAWPRFGCGQYGEDYGDDYGEDYGESVAQNAGTHQQWRPEYPNPDHRHSQTTPSTSCSLWGERSPHEGGHTCFMLGAQGPACQGEHMIPQQPSHAEDTLKRTQKVSQHERRRRGRSGFRAWRWRRVAEGRGCLRPRTVLTESQQRALLTCYSHTPRPDATTKHRLGLQTGLSLKVIRVWFQNKRCKDKKRRTKGADHERSSGCVPTGPMVALPPDPPDIALEICVCILPWQPLSGHMETSETVMA